MTAAHSSVEPVPEPLISVEGVHTYYGKSHVLHGVSLEVGRGEVVGLIGRNGVGKSTTLKTIMGIINASAGRISFEGRQISGLPPHKLARIGIAYVPEDRRIFRLLTVMENLRTGLDRDGVSEGRKKQLLEKLFTYFPRLAERRGQPGGTLSGGEQQMLAMSRALVTDPAVLLLDELSMGLAPIVVQQLYEIVGQVASEGISILVVEQFAQAVLGIADRAAIMVNGEITRVGTPAEMQSELSSAYLGGARSTP